MDCLICFEEFNDFSTPRVFGCGHSVCRHCALRISINRAFGATMKCPVCRFAQPNLDIPPENYQMKELVKLCRARNSSINRERHSGEASATPATPRSPDALEAIRRLAARTQQDHQTIGAIRRELAAAVIRVEEVREQHQVEELPLIRNDVHLEEEAVGVAENRSHNAQPTVVVFPCDWRVTGRDGRYVTGSCTVRTRQLRGNPVKTISCKAANGVNAIYNRTLVPGHSTSIKYDGKSVNIFGINRDLQVVLRFSGYPEAKQFQDALAQPV